MLNYRDSAATIFHERMLYLRERGRDGIRKSRVSFGVAIRKSPPIITSLAVSSQRFAEPPLSTVHCQLLAPLLRLATSPTIPIASAAMLAGSGTVVSDCGTATEPSITVTLPGQLDTS
jgi:hypothetical protein